MGDHVTERERLIALDVLRPDRLRPAPWLAHPRTLRIGGIVPAIARAWAEVERRWATENAGGPS